MRTNFFQALQRLQSVGAWVINVDFSEGNELIVSVVVKSAKEKEQKIQLPPMIFKGTPQEIDEGILDGLTQPVVETKTLFANFAAYNKGLEEAKAKLSAKPKADKQPSTAEKQNPVEAVPNKPKFEDILKEINTLNASCKYAEAVTIVPSAQDYPDKKAEIEKLKADLQWRMKQLTLL